VSAFHVLWRFTALRGLISTRRPAIAFGCGSVVWCSVADGVCCRQYGPCSVADGVCCRQYGPWTAELRFECSKGSGMFRLSLLSKKIKNA
jgi:hypothetical protein